MRRNGLLLIFVLCACLIAAQDKTQDAPKGSFKGVVVDEDQAIIPRATVLLIDVTTLLTHRTTTDANGEFQFEGLATNHDFMVISRAQCFRPAIVRKVLVNSGKPLKIKLSFGGEGCTQVSLSSG